MFKFLTAAKAHLTVNDVLSAFDKNISDLEELQAHQLYRADCMQQESSALITQATAARTEAARAETVTGKLRALICA